MYVCIYIYITSSSSCAAAAAAAAAAADTHVVERVLQLTHGHLAMRFT
jgi:hypothetical protein